MERLEFHLEGVLVPGTARSPSVRVVGAFLYFEAHGQVPDIGGVVEEPHPLAPGVEVEAGIEAGDVVDQVFVDDRKVSVVEHRRELIAARRDLRAGHAPRRAAEKVAHRRDRVARNSRQVFIGEKKRRRRIVAAGRPHHVFAKLAARGRRLRRDVAVGTDDLVGLAVKPRSFAEEVPNPDIGERAKCREPRLGFEERRGEAAHVANHGDAVGGHRCCLEADRIGAGEADRFLDEDVLAGPKRRGRMLVVVLVGTEDKDHVNQGSETSASTDAWTLGTRHRSPTRFMTDGETSVTVVTVNRSWSR